MTVWFPMLLFYRPTANPEFTGGDVRPICIFAGGHRLEALLPFNGPDFNESEARTNAGLGLTIYQGVV